MFFRHVVKWSPVEVEYLKAHRDEAVSQLTIALAKSKNAIHNKLLELDGKPVKKAKKSPTKIGKRKDLGLFLRSGWEANVARYFKHHNIKFMYEPQNFLFDKFKHGTVSYVPDFLIMTDDIQPVGLWIEVKGMLKGTDKTRIRRFKKFYPEEFKKLLVICNPNTATETFFKEQGVPIYKYYKDLDKAFKQVIPNWE